MQYIPVKIHTTNQVVMAMVDDDSYDDVCGMSWYLDKDGYPRHSTRLNGRPKSYALHRYVMGVEIPDIIVDHRNHNKLDCQRDNLRITDIKGNSRNKICRSSSGRTGVHWDKRHNMWQASITVDGKKIHLGWFSKDKLQLAIDARESAELKYWRSVDNE